jgi:hypothetical protein
MPPAKRTKKGDSKDFELGQQIAELKGVVNTGFAGVNQRLDTLNGRVGKHDELFGKVLGDEKFQAGVRKGISTFWGVVIAVLGIIIGALTAYATFEQKPVTPVQASQTISP